MKNIQKILLLFLFLIIGGCSDFTRIYPVIKVTEVKLVDSQSGKYRIIGCGDDGKTFESYYFYTDTLYSVGDTLINLK